MLESDNDSDSDTVDKLVGVAKLPDECLTQENFEKKMCAKKVMSAEHEDGAKGYRGLND